MLSSTDILDRLDDSRFEKARGSKQGRDKSLDNTEKVKSQKSKVKSYDTIKQALAATSYGSTFTTKRSNRLYVTTKPTWGEKSRKGGNTKVAKGFSYDPPVSKIKNYSARTKVKHGGSRDRNLLKFVSSKRKERINKQVPEA